MITFRTITDSLGTPATIALDLKLNRATVASWPIRDFVPPGYWLRLVRLAARKGIKGVTLEVFARLAELKIKERA